MTLLDTLRAEALEVGLARFTASDYRPGTVTHVVLFRYTDAATSDDRAEVARRFHSLALTPRHGSPYIVSIVSGPQASAESDSFEDGFVVTFASLGDRNFYVGEPVIDDPAFFDQAHAVFKAFVGDHLASVEVFDVAHEPVRNDA
jgi:hypothetical protein